ncbi:unnamed protein product [Caenorhabditis brenneri]
MKLVIQNMPDIKKIVISFCSKRAKFMAVSPGIRERDFIITIGNTYTACYRDTVRYVDFSETENPKEESIRLDVWSGEELIESIFWDQSGLSLMERINHVNDLFPDVTKSSTMFEMDSFDLNALPFLRNSDVTHLWIPHTQTNSDFNIQILNHFKMAKSIELCCPRFGSASQVKSILTRHYHKIRIRSFFMITFDELLSTNCRYLLIENVPFSRTQMNKFLKIWRCGSNRHLRYLRCSFDSWSEPWNYNYFGSFLKGLNAKYLSCVRLTEFVDSRGNTTTVQGGYEIWNKDGIRGVLHFLYNRNVLEFIISDQ